MWGPLVCETNVITNYTTQTMWWAVVFLFICSLCVVCTSDGYLIILRPNSSSSFACVNLHKTVSDSQRSVVPLSMSYVNNSSLFFRVLFRAEPHSFNNWIKRRLHPCRWHTTWCGDRRPRPPPPPPRLLSPDPPRPCRDVPPFLLPVMPNINTQPASRCICIL